MDGVWSFGVGSVLRLSFLQFVSFPELSCSLHSLGASVFLVRYFSFHVFFFLQIIVVFSCYVCFDVFMLLRFVFLAGGDYHGTGLTTTLPSHHCNHLRLLNNIDPSISTSIPRSRWFDSYSTLRQHFLLSNLAFTPVRSIYHHLHTTTSRPLYRGYHRPQNIFLVLALQYIIGDFCRIKRRTIISSGYRSRWHLFMFRFNYDVRLHPMMIRHIS